MIVREHVSKYICDACGKHSVLFQETPVEGWMVIMNHEDKKDIQHLCQTCGHLFEYSLHERSFSFRETAATAGG